MAVLDGASLLPTTTHKQERSKPRLMAHRVAALNGLLGVVAGRVKQGHQAHHDPVGAVGAIA